MPEEHSFEQGPTSFLTFRLARTQNLLNAQASHTLRQHCDLSLSEWRVLSLVAAQGETSAAAVSRIGEMDKGQVSRAQKSLVEGGYLTANTNRQDHRQHILRATPLGLETYERVVKVMQRRQQNLVSEFSAEELERFLELLARIEERAHDEVS